MVHNNGLSTEPKVIAELGPGDSLGIGLAGLLCGADKYYALDVVKYANTQVNLDIFEELVLLLNKKEPIPDEQEFPRVRPLLESYEFPHHILTDDRLQQSLRNERIDAIRNALANLSNSSKNDIEIRYFVPWYDSNVINKESIDMIFSQAVLEHVEALPETYKALYQWLKPDGFMSHQIDFGCHGLAKHWNGHWGYPDFMWKLVKGKRPFLLNREPYSTHNRLLRESGFETIHEIKITDKPRITKNTLSYRLRNMSSDDSVTRGVYILARKKQGKDEYCHSSVSS